MRRRANEQEEAQAVNEARSELRRKLNESSEKLKPHRQEIPGEEKKSSRAVRVGDVVEIISIGMKAEVIEANPDGTLSLRSGMMTARAKQSEVFLLEGAQSKPKRKVYSTGTAVRTAAVAPEIDLRGMESLEAVATAEMYIDSAVMAKLKSVTIIHGKGTGALRAAVQQMLKHNKSVKSFRLGRYGEGETGVTVVELK